MPKFTFPMPGRRRKPASNPDMSGPMSKAQRILGTGEINVDSPVQPKDQLRPWEARSNSVISISISESSTTYDRRDGALDRLPEGEVASPTSPRLGAVEEESDIIPRSLREVRSMTDASSLRRRQSSSTIMSYYDKSKVPLVISQQTSNSAMAKGLPNKANTLLDINGTLSPPRDKEKKKRKPARLDLSHLLSKGRSPKSVKAQRGPLLGPDMVTRSPSTLSPSPSDRVARPFRRLSGRKHRRTATKERLQDGHATALSSPQQAAIQSWRMRDAAKLSSLYDHYEERSVRDVMGPNAIVTSTTPESETPSLLSAPPTTSTKGLLTPFGNSAVPAPFSSMNSWVGNSGPLETPITAVMSPPSLQSPSVDCAASVSSRHTRTSKASKRTNQSMGELDLLQNSVLSLSSDSEDDFLDAGLRTSLSVPSNGPRSPVGSSPDSRRQATARKSPSDTQLPELTDSSTPGQQSLDVADGDAAASRPLVINPRTSSLSLATATTPRRAPFPLHNSSRLSMISTSTGNSITPAQRTPRRQGKNGVHEARAIKMIPALESSYDANHSPTSHGHAADQPTPPLSPSSMDFYLRSQHTSVVDFDQGSVRSAKSMGTIGSGRHSARGSTARVMAVTRQEEMLLAALRMKRARMRETAISESDEEKGGQLPPVDAKKNSRRSSTSTVTEPLQPRKSSVSFTDFPMYIQNPPARPPPVSARSAPISKASSDVGDRGRHEKVLLYLNRPVNECSSVNDLYGAEPSPDLSDFMDFDDTGSSDSFPFQTSDSHSPLGGRHQLPGKASPDGPPRLDSELPSPDSEPPSPRTKPRSLSLGEDEVPVRIFEDPLEIPMGRRVRALEDEVSSGIPRPDSPVNASLDLPVQGDDVVCLPRKKMVRISAVGRVGMEAGWWDDDG